MLGDADQNGEIQVEDAVLVLQTYAQQSAGLEVTLTDDVFRAMDVDGDGVVAVEDAVAILTYYAKTCAGLNPEW
jgi:Ca2+-binding EF-hand superfamily protein